MFFPVCQSRKMKKINYIRDFTEKDDPPPVENSYTGSVERRDKKAAAETAANNGEMPQKKAVPRSGE